MPIDHCRLFGLEERMEQLLGDNPQKQQYYHQQRKTNRETILVRPIISEKQARESDQEANETANIFRQTIKINDTHMDENKIANPVASAVKEAVTQLESQRTPRTIMTVLVGHRENTIGNRRMGLKDLDRYQEMVSISEEQKTNLAFSLLVDKAASWKRSLEIRREEPMTLVGGVCSKLEQIGQASFIIKRCVIIWSHKENTLKNRVALSLGFNL